MTALWQLSHTELERSSPDFVAEYRRTVSTAKLVLMGAWEGGLRISTRELKAGELVKKAPPSTNYNRGGKTEAETEQSWQDRYRRRSEEMRAANKSAAAADRSGDLVAALMDRTSFS
jgi:hypothetical protein